MSENNEPHDNVKYHPMPQPDELSQREKEDAMGAYLMMFAAVAVALPLPVINLIAAIIYYVINKKKGLFVHFHCLQSLLSQIPTTLINWGLLFWIIQIFINDDVSYSDDNFKAYLLMAVVANLLYFIFSILGAIRARAGRFYYFVFFGRLSYELVFKVKSSSGFNNVSSQNRPPA